MKAYIKDQNKKTNEKTKGCMLLLIFGLRRILLKFFLKSYLMIEHSRKCNWQQLRAIVPLVLICWWGGKILKDNVGWYWLRTLAGVTDTSLVLIWLLYLWYDVTVSCLLLSHARLCSSLCFGELSLFFYYGKKKLGQLFVYLGQKI